jgi:hypothetical protein
LGSIYVDARVFRATAIVVLIALQPGCNESRNGIPSVTWGQEIDTTRAGVVLSERLPDPVRLDNAETIQLRDSSGAEVPLFRVTDLLLGPGGRFHVANSGSAEIITFDSLGSLRWRVAGRGDGPREFRVLGLLQAWQGDTIAAIDSRRNSISFWTGSAVHIRTIAAGPLPMEPADADATLLFLPLPGADVFELRIPGRMPAVLTPMSRLTALAVRGEHLLWARSDAYAIAVLEPQGHVVRILQVAQRLRAVSPEIRRAYLESWSPWFPVTEEIPFPREITSFDRVFAGADGRIWARLYHWGDKPEEWVVFSDRHGVEAAFSFPPRIRVRSADTRVALGIARDSQHVERVVRFSLQEGGSLSDTGASMADWRER